MKKAILISLCSVLLLAMAACSKKGADETTPIEQIKAAAEKMDTTQLRSMALRYKEAIAEKQTDLAAISERIKAIDPAELLGQRATQLKAELASVEKSIDALTERFKIYIDQLKAKAGDLTGLEL